MKILTHGIHYFVHSVEPLLKQNKFLFKNKIIKNNVYTDLYLMELWESLILTNV